MKSHKPATKKSALVREAEKVFPVQPQAAPAGYEPHLTYIGEPVVMQQTFTTYSVCEDPIPNPFKRS
jgi:hypothetical protein